ncbi:hypothetical protein [Aerococcus loyolae]|uniref:Uncharacterized protein n=1 Tax=Aerococcus urinae TaxID=1376 RepID=A0A329NVN1_9LACT|nr:hypothetical protein DBT54_09815 [Aerococcus loyolae]
MAITTTFRTRAFGAGGISIGGGVAVSSGMMSSQENERGGQRHAVTVPPEAAGTRLDKYLTDALADKEEALSRARLQALIGEGRVSRKAGGGAELTVLGTRVVGCYRDMERAAHDAASNHLKTLGRIVARQKVSPK